MAKNNHNQKNRKNNKANKAAAAYNSAKKGSINSDVLGSYTGTPYSGSVPDQDSDDL